MLTIYVMKLHPDAKLPTRAYPGDAGWDLYTLEKTHIAPGVRKDITTGLAIEIPDGHYGRVTGRSSTIRKWGLHVYEGVADSGFRGEWRICVENRNRQIVIVNAFTSLAQLVVTPVPETELVEVEMLNASERGERGYGSSG